MRKASTTKTVKELHRGDAFIVGNRHCLVDQLDKDTEYKLFVSLVGAGLADGTTPGRGIVHNMLHATVVQGGQEQLNFLLKHLTKHSPAVTKALQDIAVANKDAL